MLEIKNVTKSYKNKNKKALDDISLNLESGGFLALLGHNGAGKSTLINIIGNMVVRNEGDIFVDNYHIDNNFINFRKSVAIVPQDIVFDPFFTPFRSVQLQAELYGIKTTKQEVLRVLEKLGLEEQAFSSTRQLSGGMKRRVLIAKALITKPKVLFLDEPTAGVDIMLRDIIWNNLKELNKQGTTIVLTTHYLQEAQQLCNQVAIIKNGKLIANESKENLLTKADRVLEIKFNKNLDVVPTKITNKFNVEIDTKSLKFKLTKEDSIQDMIDSAKLLKLEIKDINIQEPDLESIFLNITKENT